MTTQPWRQRDPADGDIDWRAIRADGAVVAGLVKLGRSTVVYTYDGRLAALDGARFASAEAARAAVDTALAAPVRPRLPALAPTAAAIPRELTGQAGGRADRRVRSPKATGAGFHDG